MTPYNPDMMRMDQSLRTPGSPQTPKSSKTGLKSVLTFFGKFQKKMKLKRNKSTEQLGKFFIMNDRGFLMTDNRHFLFFWTFPFGIDWSKQPRALIVRDPSMLDTVFYVLLVITKFSAETTKESIHCFYVLYGAQCKIVISILEVWCR